MAGLGAREVASMLGWPVSRVYSFVRDGLVTPSRNGRTLRFDFRDLVVLRTAHGLIQRQLSPTQVKASLRELRRRLPSGKSLSATRLAAHGRAVTIRDHGAVWELGTGQGTLDFVNPTEQELPQGDDNLIPVAADEWFNLGARLEDVDPNRAAYAYGRAIELEPQHSDALCNLGGMLQRAGRGDEAMDHYVQALAVHPDHMVARFNLGTVLEELGDSEQALQAYAKVAAELPDARYNRARLLEQMGRQREAIAELKLLIAQTEPGRSP